MQAYPWAKGSDQRGNEHGAEPAGAGKSVIMVPHDLPVALQSSADHIAVMEKGRLISFGSPEKVFASGCLNHIFGVTVARFSTDSGWKYCYDTK